MNKEDTYLKDVQNHIKKVISPIFIKVLQETDLNRMSVGGGSVQPKPKQDISFYQPHNYRLYLDFSKEFFRPPSLTKVIKTDPKGSVVTTTYKYKIKNSTEHYFQDYQGCNITVKKTQIEIINKIEHKRWYVIKHGLADEYATQIKKIINKKDSEVFEVLTNFIKEFGGSSEFKILNRKSEDKIQGENSIDKVGLKNNFHNKTCKKVYKEPNVEFNNSMFASNYFENRSIERIAPEIGKRLDNLQQELNKIFPQEIEGFKDVNTNITEGRRLYQESLEILQHDLNKGVVRTDLEFKGVNTNIAESRRLYQESLDRFKIEALEPLTEQIKVHLEVQQSTLILHRRMSRTLISIDRNMKKKWYDPIIDFFGGWL